MIQYIKSRLAEFSTWRGVLLIGSAFGLWSFTDDQQHAIEAIGLAIFGASHFTPDNISK